MSHNGFPGFAVCSDGSYFCCYRKGTSHNEPPTSTPGILKAKRSTDQGKTWGTEYTVWTPPSGFEVRDSMATTLTDGRIAVTFNPNDYPGYVTSSMVMFSSNHGVTFGAPVQIISSTPLMGGPSGTGLAIEGPIVELTAGHLLVGVYGYKPGGTKTSCLVLHSTNNGATWSDLAICADGDAAAQDYIEPILLLLDTGELVCSLRRNDGKIFIVRSQDNGVTWSTPYQMFLGSGRPAMQQMSNGVVVMVYRSNATNDLAMRTSWNRCWSWEPEINFEADLFRVTYAQLQEVETNVLGCLYSIEESSATDASIRYTTLRVRETVDPLA